MEELDYYTRTCRYCEKTFVTNHGNRFFCDPATQEVGERNCKVTYNNLKAKNRRDLTKDFNNRAYLNWMILDNLWLMDEFTVSGEYLKSMKFSIKHFTGTVKSSELGVQIPVFYGYTLENLGGNQFKLSRI